ncbi:MAG: polysaccharide biosynthesis C-terminal domain-containing protein [Flavobacteriales bacterium]|nr:polysaccharide biosynthesis C-terminal domain-containing protein [Flavobacteriales bacterium]
MLKKILSTFSAQFLSGILTLVIVVLTARELGTDGRGVISLLILNISLVLMFSGFVGGGALVYLTPRENFGRLLVAAYFWAIIAAISVSATLTITGLSPEKFTLHLFCLSLINAFNGVNTNLLIGQERLHQRNFSIFFQVLVQLIVFYGILQQSGERSVYSYIQALYVAYLTSFVLSSFFLLKKKKRIVSQSFGTVLKSLFSYGLYTQIGGFVQLLNFRFSYYMLEKYHGVSVLGVYSTGVSLIEALWIISRSISLVLYSRISNAQDDDYSRVLTIKLIKFAIVLTAFCLVPLLLIPTDIYIMIFDGESFAEIKLVFLYLGIGTVMFSASAMLSAYLSGTGQFKVNTKASLIGLTATIALGFWLIPDYEMLGAGLTASVSYFITVSYQIHQFCKITKTRLAEFFPKKGDLQLVQQEIRSYISI